MAHLQPAALFFLHDVPAYKMSLAASSLHLYEGLTSAAASVIDILKDSTHPCLDIYHASKLAIMSLRRIPALG